MSRAIATALALAVALGAVVVAPASAATPVISWTVEGPRGDNGWYVGTVTVTWTVTDGQPAAGCGVQTYRSETAGTLATCDAANSGGTAHANPLLIKIDSSAPQVTSAIPGRPPDRAGWYNHPIGFTWAGADAGPSGLQGCTTATYAGPDNGAATLSGSCRDQAGNTGTLSVPVRYDATPPTLADVTATGGDTSTDVRWKAEGATNVSVTRSSRGSAARTRTIYTGAGDGVLDTGLSNGKTYAYTIVATDEAANTAVARTSARPAVRLLGPPIGARMNPASPPVLRWKRVRGAAYYNVQLYRHGRKILSVWPQHARVALRSSWTYRGKHHRLVPGTYRWYVWAGFGKRSKQRYGHLLGTRPFVVT